MHIFPLGAELGGSGLPARAGEAGWSRNPPLRDFMTSQFVGSSPTSGTALTVWKPSWDSLSLSPCFLPHSYFLSLKNK